MASRRMNRGQEVQFPTSAPDLNEEIESMDLNSSSSLTGAARDTLLLFPDVPASYTPSMPQNHAQGASNSVFGMPPYSQTEVKHVMIPQNYLQEVPLPATSTAGIPFFENNVNRYNQYPNLDNAMIPEDKMMAIRQINHLEKPRIERNITARARFMDGHSLGHNFGCESTTDTKIRPIISANEPIQAEMKSENVPTLGLGAGSYMENRPRDDVSSVSSTGGFGVDRSSFSLFNRSQPNVGGVAFRSGLSTHHNEVPLRPERDEHQMLQQNFSGFPQPAENGMLLVENLGGFPSNLQNVGGSSIMPQNSNADTLSPFVFEPHAYQAPANWNLELQGYRAAPPSEVSHTTDGFWGSLADLPGLHNNNQVSFPGGYEQSDLARLQSSNSLIHRGMQLHNNNQISFPRGYEQSDLARLPSSNSLIHRGMQPDSFQMKHPYLGTHNDFSSGSYIFSPSMGVTRSINSSQELTGNVGLPQAIAPVQLSRDVTTTTYRAGISSTPSSLVSNVPAAATAASGSVSVGPSRKRSMPQSRSDTQQAACKQTRSIFNSVQSSPSVAYSGTNSVTSPGWNASLSTVPYSGTPLFPPQTSTTPLYPPQLTTAGLRPPQVSTVGLCPPLVRIAGLRPLAQVSPVAVCPPQGPRIASPIYRAPAVPLRPPPRVPTVAHRPRPAPTVPRSLPSASSMEHIKWQGPEGDPVRSEFKCLLCMRDLPFSPEGTMAVPRNPPPVSVLPCHHQFHTYCLDRITPQEQAANPPCIPCAMGGTIK